MRNPRIARRWTWLVNKKKRKEKSCQIQILKASNTIFLVFLYRIKIKPHKDPISNNDLISKAIKLWWALKLFRFSYRRTKINTWFFPRFVKEKMRPNYSLWPQKCLQMLNWIFREINPWKKCRQNYSSDFKWNLM